MLRDFAIEISGVKKLTRLQHRRTIGNTVDIRMDLSLSTVSRSRHHINDPDDGSSSGRCPLSFRALPSQPAEAFRHQDQLRQRFGMTLLHNVLTMKLYGPFRCSQRMSDFLVQLTLHQQVEDFVLSWS